MPTLTPKPNKLQFPALERLRRLVAVTPVDDDDTQQVTDADVCFVCFDALQGILAVMLVYRNFQAAFSPCQVFGSSAAMVKDISVCDNEDTTLSSWGLPLPSQSFCISAFFMIAGIRLSHKLWKAPIDLFRVTVVQRIVHLFLCGGAAILLGAALSLVSMHDQVAEVTKSLWLHGWNTEFDGYANLISQMLLGPLHQTITVNPSLWVLSFEMVGSSMIAGLVLLLKASPHKLRSRWLMALFVAMLVPSVTRTNRMSVNLEYNILAGSEDKVASTRSVGIDPIHHSHLLQHISEWSNSGHEKSTSALELLFEEQEKESWFRKEASATVALDSNNQATSNALLFDELLKASDKKSHSVSAPWVRVATQSKWGRSAPWLLLSSFVGAAWISEALLSSTFSRVGRGPTYRGQRLLLAIPCVALLSASYPETSQMVATGYIWKVMEAAAGLLGFSGTHASQFWGIVGALFLSLSTCLFAADLRKAVVFHRHWLGLGKIGFSLVVTHSPVLGSLSCGAFLFCHRFLDDVYWAGFLTLFVSIPAVLGLASTFYRLVHVPVDSISEHISRRFLGLIDSYPEQGFSTIDENKKLMAATNSSSQTTTNAPVGNPL